MPSHCLCDCVGTRHLADLQLEAHRHDHPAFLAALLGGEAGIATLAKRIVYVGSCVAAMLAPGCSPRPEEPAWESAHWAATGVEEPSGRQLVL